MLPQAEMGDSSPTHVCPKGNADSVERVPKRGVIGHVASAFGRRLYGCLDCATEFYDWRALRKAS